MFKLTIGKFCVELDEDACSRLFAASIIVGIMVMVTAIVFRLNP